MASRSCAGAGAWQGPGQHGIPVQGCQPGVVQQGAGSRDREGTAWGSMHGCRRAGHRLSGDWVQQTWPAHTQCWAGRQARLKSGLREQADRSEVCLLQKQHLPWLQPVRHAGLEQVTPARRMSHPGLAFPPVWQDLGSPHTNTSPASCPVAKQLPCRPIQHAVVALPAASGLPSSAAGASCPSSVSRGSPL